MDKILKKMEEVLQKDREVFNGSATNKTAGLQMMYDEIKSFVSEQQQRALCLSVGVYTKHNGEERKIYTCIDTLEDAYLLAQLAMVNKEDHELIVIFPGWNIGIERNHENMYERAILLASQHKYERFR